MSKKVDSSELNYDMNYNLFLLKTAMPNLRTAKEKANVTQWVHKLLSSNKTMSEMRLRNEFMFHLVIAVQEGVLRPPFSQNPPSSSPLSNLKYLLSGASPNAEDGKKDSNAWECEDSDGEDEGKPMLYKQSPDGGAFLAAQPVPKCGAFSYVAVISKPKTKEENHK